MLRPSVFRVFRLLNKIGAKASCREKRRHICKASFGLQIAQECIAAQVSAVTNCQPCTLHQQQQADLDYVQLSLAVVCKLQCLFSFTTLAKGYDSSGRKLPAAVLECLRVKLANQHSRQGKQQPSSLAYMRATKHRNPCLLYPSAQHRT